MKCKQSALCARQRNQRGSAILYALLVTVFMTFAFYGVSTLVMDQNRETKSNEHIMKSHLALHSMIDYTLLGLKKRWCFTDQWMPETPSACSLAHPAAAERIVMGDDAARVIAGMVTSKQLKAPVGNPIQLESIEKTISVKNFSATHPIYSIVQAISKVGVVSSIRIGIYRDHRASLPQQGREVYLKIVTSLLDSTGKVITIGSSRLQATSYLGVYPRELSGFALILPNNLYLDRKTSAGLGKGDNFFQMFDSRASALSMPGISFDSPVFVNGDVVVPPRGPEKGDTVYTPVSFNDRIVLGSGRIKQQNDVLYKTRTQGADGDQLWVQAREFGGFVKGVDVDGVSDAGLDALAGIGVSPSSPNLDTVNKCIERNKRLADLNTTQDTQLYGRNVATVLPNQFKYQLFLSQGNRFNRQKMKIEPGNYDPNHWKDGTPYASDDGRAIVKVKANIDGRWVESEITDDGGFLELKPKVNLTNYINTLKKSLDDAKDKLDDAEKAKDEADKALNGPPNPALLAQLSTAEKDLKNEMAKPTPTPTPSPSPSPSPSPTVTPSPSPSPEPSPSPSPSPTVTPSPSPVPTATVSPSPSPTVDPTEYYDQAKVDALKTKINNLKGQISTQQNKLDKALKDIDDSTKAIASIEKELNEANANKNLQPVIRIDIEKTRGNPSYRDFILSLTYPGALRNDDGSMMDMNFKVLAYDVSYYRGSPMWWEGAKTREFNLSGQIKLGWSGTTPVIDTMFYDNNNKPRPWPGTIDNDDTDWDAVCASSAADFSTAFEGADWNISFLSSVRQSWDFTGSQNEVFLWNKYNADKAAGTAVFLVKSIAKECRVESTADFVAGFYTCDHLIIEPRNRPLRIIGTIIAVKMTIDPSVYQYGLRWSSIFSPMSVYELREAGILRSTYTDIPCEKVDFPLWHPYPSQIDLANSYTCNPISLRAKADPFTWTSVDPDCGVINAGTPAVATTCKNRLLNFNVIEISRDAGI